MWWYVKHAVGPFLSLFFEKTGKEEKHWRQYKCILVAAQMHQWFVSTSDAIGCMYGRQMKKKVVARGKWWKERVELIWTSLFHDNQPKLLCHIHEWDTCRHWLHQSSCRCINLAMYIFEESVASPPPCSLYFDSSVFIEIHCHCASCTQWMRSYLLQWIPSFACQSRRLYHCFDNTYNIQTPNVLPLH